MLHSVIKVLLAVLKVTTHIHVVIMKEAWMLSNNMLRLSLCSCVSASVLKGLLQCCFNVKYPEVMVLYYQFAHLRMDPNLWNSIAMTQAVALKRLARAISSSNYCAGLICLVCQSLAVYVV